MWAGVALVRAVLGTMWAGVALVRAGLGTMRAGVGLARAVLGTMWAGVGLVRARLGTMRAGVVSGNCWYVLCGWVVVRSVLGTMLGWVGLVRRSFDSVSSRYLCGYLFLSIRVCVWGCLWGLSGLFRIFPGLVIRYPPSCVSDRRPG
jgi:hypothetical protein